MQPPKLVADRGPEPGARLYKLLEKPGRVKKTARAVKKKRLVPAPFLGGSPGPERQAEKQDRQDNPPKGAKDGGFSGIVRAVITYI